MKENTDIKQAQIWSSSPDRNSFQKNNYLKRMEELGKEPNKNYLDFFESLGIKRDKDSLDPEWQKDNLEYDLRSTDWILEKVRNSDNYAQNLYAAMCNNGFIKNDVWPILTSKEWSCSWRYAGGIIADMQQKGDYIDWYCSGIRDEPKGEDINNDISYVNEGCITDEIRDDLLKLGWLVAPGGDNEQF